jgi:hypothetical protein
MSISGFGIIPNDGATNAQRVKNESKRDSVGYMGYRNL